MDSGLIFCDQKLFLFFNNLEEVVKIYQLKLMRVTRVGDNWWVVIVSIKV